MSLFSRFRRKPASQGVKPPSLRKRYFGISGFTLHGGVYAATAPDRRFHIELIDPSGEVISSTRADRESLKPDIPDGYGFAIPVPAGWFSENGRPETFQFRVVETGDRFPKVPREVPLSDLLTGIDWRTAVDHAVVRKIRGQTAGIVDKAGAGSMVAGTHAMTRTGAPMIVLEVLRHLKQRYDVRIILLCGGPAGSLYPEFRAVCTEVVEDLDRARQIAPRVTSAFFEALAGSVDHRVALINSLCSTNLAEDCRRAGLSVMSLVHEYPYAFTSEQVQRHLQASRCVVFPCRDVYRRFADGSDSSILPASVRPEFAILPQGCYQIQAAPVSDAETDPLLESIRAEIQLTPDDRLVVCCGTIEARKGFDWLAALIRYYRSHSPRSTTTHFLWIGGVGQHDLFEHALHDLRQDGLIGQFHHIDEQEDVRPLMRLADVFLLCSRIDPFPSVVLEAFHAGVPVVGFDRDQGCAEMIAGTGFGKIVAARNLAATTKAIDELLEGSAEAQAVARHGAAFVAEHFQFPSYADRIAGYLFDGVPLPDAASYRPAFLDEDVPGTEGPARENATCPLAGHAENRAKAPATPVRRAFRRGLDWLSSCQLPDGEFLTLLSTEPSLEEGRWDSSPFVTSLIAQSLERALPEPEARVMINRALSFLEVHMEPGGVWRYYTKKQFKHDRIPPDLDDTSCAAGVLKRNGRRLPDNGWIYDALRGSDGRYYTWVLPEASSSKEFVAYLDTLEALATAVTPPMPPEAAANPRFASSAKDPVAAGEVDPVVNANVVFYLGENARTKPVIEYLVDFVNSPSVIENDLGAYYTDVASLFYMIARAGRAGAPSLNAARDAILDYLERRLDGSAEGFGGNSEALITAMSVCALLYFAPDSKAIATAIERLITLQRPDGSWPRAAFYRGPHEFWGSDELTTAFCLEALAGYEANVRVSESAESLGNQQPSKKRNAGSSSISIDLDAPDHCRDPYPTFKLLRERHPVVFNEVSQSWLISSYEDCVHVLNDPSAFMTRGHSFETTLMGADGETHRRVRSAVRVLFQPERLAALEGLMEGWMDDLLTPLRGRDTCDFLEAVANPLPIRVVSHLLGLDLGMVGNLRRWAEALLSAKNATGDDDITLGIRECREFFGRYVAELRTRSVEEEENGSPIGDLVRESLSDSEMADVFMLIMTAGFVTTNNLIGNAAMILATRPKIRARLRQNPDETGTFLEEVLRFESPAQDVFRTTTEPVVIGGQSIGAGEVVQLMIGSANRDEAKFEAADSFLPDRRPNPHLTFGRGPHQCLGMMLARIEARVAIRKLLQEFPEFTADWSPLEDPPLRNYFLLRGVEHLPLKLHASIAGPVKTEA